MMRALIPVVALVLLVLSSSTAFAVDGDGDLLRFSVAVLDFEVNDLTGAVIRPEQLGRAMATQFEVPLVQSRRFVVLTRRDLDRVLDELALADTGLLNPTQAREFGRLANVEVIITGTITVFAGDAYSVSTIFIDVETGELSVAETFETSSPQGFFDVAMRVVDRALQQYPLRGTVLEVDGDDVYIDIGQVHGLTGRDRGGVIDRPREVAGRSITERIGTFSIEQIFGDISLIAVTFEPGRRVEVGDLVSIQALPEIAETTPQRPQVAPPPEELGPEPVLGRLVLETIPEGARVFVDDDEVGASVELASGRYDVSVRAVGFLEERFEVEIRDGESVERRVTLTRRAPTVTFDVTPNDAVIRLEGDVVVDGGVTVEPGVFRLTIEAPGHEPHAQRLIVVPGQDQRISVELAPLSARLRTVVVHAAVGSTVLARGSDGLVDLGTIDVVPQSFALPVDRYELIFSAPDDAPWRDTRPVETIRVDLTMAEDDDLELFAPGYLSIQGPSESSVSVAAMDGTLAYRGGPRAFVSLAPGTYRIGLADGSEQREVVIAAGTAIDVTVDAAARGEPPVASDARTDVERQGTLTMTVNVDAARVTVRGPTEREFDVGREPMTVSLPDGLYVVVARAPGRIAIDDAFAIDEGAEERLDLRFSDQRVSVGLGVHRQGDETRTMLVWHAGDALATGAVRIEVVGPPAWNGGRPYVASVDADQGGVTVVLSVPPVPGRYTIESFVTRTASTVNEAALVELGSLSLPDRLRLDSPSGDSLRVRWGGVRGAAMYTVEVRNDASVWRAHVEPRPLVTPTARFDRIGLADGSAVSVCIAAWSWDGRADGAPPTSGAAVSETCTSYTPRSTAPADVPTDGPADADPVPPAPPPAPPPPPP